MDFGQVAFVFGLGSSPRAGNSKGTLDFSRIATTWYTEAARARSDDALQSAQNGLVDQLVEEFHVLGASLETSPEAVSRPFGQVHVVFKLEEGHFRLDHQNSAKWRDVLEFSAGRWAQRRSFPARRQTPAFQLAADGQIREPIKSPGVVDRRFDNRRGVR